MSKLTELLNELCPGGVEYVRLENHARTVNGLTGKKKSDFSDGNAKFITYRNVFSNPEVDLGIRDHVKVADGEKQNQVELGDVIFTGSSESREEVGLSAVVTQTPAEPIYLNSFCFVVRFEDPEFMDPRFAKHLFRSRSIRKQIVKAANGVTRINISKPRFMQIEIPVVPMEVQQEIVRVLDAFTDLEQSLVSELELRKKQYEFYRDELLSFTANGGDLCSDEVEYRPLGEVIVLHPGVRITRKNDSGTLYPVYGGGGESFRTDNFNRTNDYVISRFAMSENCVRYVPEEFWLLDSGISFEATPTVLKDYVGHNLMQMQPQIFQCSGKSAQRNLRVKDFLTLTLPVPPLEAQQEIVAKLDTFDSLIQSIEQEISLRRKQYEFYRDELLNFVPKED